MGSLLILLGVGVLVFDGWFAPRYPVLLLTGLAATLLAARELALLLPEPRPRYWVCYGGVLTVVLANWPAHVLRDPWLPTWGWIAAGLVIALLLAFFVEAAHYRVPGGSIVRVALAFWIVSYIGLLACFCLQTRWLGGGDRYGAIALALAIFVPKSADIGAYFTGRLFGRHRMAPVLSPKKTWEGATGGLVFSAAVAAGINGLGIPLASGLLLSWPSAIALGVAAGILGQLGDLMESMIKRDSERKDASALVPGFGGVLDVLDSILFSAPLTYIWLAIGM